MSTFVDDEKDHLIKLVTYCHGKSIISLANRCVNLNAVSAVDLAFIHVVSLRSVQVRRHYAGMLGFTKTISH